MLSRRVPPAAELTHATVLFADMRGYTTLAERLPPGRVVCLLEEFFAILGLSIARSLINDRRLRG